MEMTDEVSTSGNESNSSKERSLDEPSIPDMVLTLFIDFLVD